MKNRQLFYKAIEYKGNGNPKGQKCGVISNNFPPKFKIGSRENCSAPRCVSNGIKMDACKGKATKSAIQRLFAHVYQIRANCAIVYELIS